MLKNLYFQNLVINGGIGVLPSLRAASGVGCSLMRLSPRSSGDRAAASGAVRAGSNPAEGAAAVVCLSAGWSASAASAAVTSAVAVSMQARCVKAVAQPLALRP